MNLNVHFRNRLRGIGSVALAAALLVAGGLFTAVVPNSATAQLSLENHDAFLAWAVENDYRSYFIGEMRWGANLGLARDWQVGLTETGSEDVIDSAELLWGDDALPFDFAYNPEPPESATLDVNGTSVTGDVSSFISEPVSSVVIRAYADVENGGGASTQFALRLLTGELLYSSALVGDGDGQFFVFDDLRLANGFAVAGWVDLDRSAETETSNSLYDPQVQIKVGTTTPEPGTVVLMATGLLGLAVAVRRRKRQETGS